MNEHVQTRLKAVVERAVRPVEMTIGRRKKTREELLAHLTHVFEEEFAREGDELAALTAAQTRFGDPRAVAADLQQSVPRYDRLLCRLDRVTRGRPGESVVRRAARWAGTVAGAYGGFVLIAAAFLNRFGPDDYEPAVAAVILSAVIVTAAVTAFVFALLAHAMRTAMFRVNSPSRAVATGLLSCAAGAAITLVLYLAASGDVTIAFGHFARSAAFLAAVPFILALVAWQVEMEQRTLREWSELQLD